MMKAILMIILALILGTQGVPAEQETTLFTVSVTVDCDFPVQSVEYVYGLGDRELGGGGCTHADGSAIQAGERVLLDFTEQNFPDGEIQDFFIDLSLTDAEGNVIECAPRLDIARPLDDTHEAAIAGDAARGYRVEWISFGE